MQNVKLHCIINTIIIHNKHSVAISGTMDQMHCMSPSQGILYLYLFFFWMTGLLAKAMSSLTGILLRVPSNCKRGNGVSCQLRLKQVILCGN